MQNSSLVFFFFFLQKKDNRLQTSVWSFPIWCFYKFKYTFFHSYLIILFRFGLWWCSSDECPCSTGMTLNKTKENWHRITYTHSITEKEEKSLHFVQLIITPFTKKKTINTIKFLFFMNDPDLKMHYRIWVLPKDQTPVSRTGAWNSILD